MIDQSDPFNCVVNDLPLLLQPRPDALWHPVGAGCLLGQSVGLIVSPSIERGQCGAISQQGDPYAGFLGMCLSHGSSRLYVA